MPKTQQVTVHILNRTSNVGFNADALWRKVCSENGRQTIDNSDNCHTHHLMLVDIFPNGNEDLGNEDAVTKLLPHKNNGQWAIDSV